MKHVRWMLGVGVALMVVSCSAAESEMVPGAATAGSASFASGAAISSAGPSGSSLFALPFDAPDLWETPHPKALVGNWHGFYMVPSAYVERFIFEESGIFYYTANRMDEADRLRYMDGTWIFEDGLLTLTVVHKIVLEGGTVVEGTGSMVREVEGGRHVPYALDAGEQEQLQYPVAVASYDEPEWLPDTSSSEELMYLEYFRGIPSVTIDGKRFWKLTSAGYDDIPKEWGKLQEALRG